MIKIFLCNFERTELIRNESKSSISHLSPEQKDIYEKPKFSS
jgi:hypothetical protein